MIRLILNITICLLVLSVKVFGAVTFEDTFTEASDTELSVHSPDTGTAWVLKTTGTTATVDSDDDKVNETTGSASMYVSDVPSVDDYVISAEITIADGSESSNGCGILFRFDTPAGVYNGYLFRTRAGSNLWQLYRYHSNTPTLLDTISQTMNTSDTFDVVLTVENNGSGNPEISVVINSAQKTWVSAASTVYEDTNANKKTTGRPGVYLKGLGRYIDDFSVNESSDSVTLTSPEQYQPYQRSTSTTGSITVTGTYTGSPTAIEASFNGGGYSTIDASPSGGTFSGTLTGQTVGQGTLTVRFTNETGVTDTAANVLIGDIFIVAGQSNADGRANNDQTYTGSNYVAVQYGDAEEWEPLDDSNDFLTSGYGSCWPLLGTLLDSNEDIPVAFVGHAAGGTAYALSDWSDGETEYEEMKDRVIAAGITDAVALLFYLGETDADEGTTASQMETYMSAMLDTLQSDTSIANLPMIAAMIGEYTSVPAAQIDAVRDGIRNAWENDTDILPGPTAHDQDFTDGVHWKTDTEILTLAQRWYRTIKHHVYNGAEDARGPVVSSIRKVDDQLLNVNFAGGSGSLNDETDTEGWTVEDDGTPVGIDSLIRHDSNTIRIDVDTDLTGTVTVSFALGSRSTDIAWHDGGTYPLPPEPFEDVNANATANSFIGTYEIFRIINK